MSFLGGTDWLDRLPKVAGATAHVHGARTEAQIERVDWDNVERTQPVVAVETGIVEAAIVVESSGRHEYAVAVSTCNMATLISAFSRPFSCAVVLKFLHLDFCRHTPDAAPVHAGSVVCQFENRPVVNSAVI